MIGNMKGADINEKEGIRRPMYPNCNNFTPLCRERPPGKEDAVTREVQMATSTASQNNFYDVHTASIIQSLRNSTFNIEELRKCKLSGKAVHLGEIGVLSAIISEWVRIRTATPRTRLPQFP